MNIKDYITKGKISMFLIALVFSLIFGAIGFACSDRVTAIPLSAIGGNLSIIGINTIADLIGFGMPVGKTPGVLGTCLGVFIIILF